MAFYKTLSHKIALLQNSKPQIALLQTPATSSFGDEKERGRKKLMGSWVMK
jgi:hypothetical protein